MPGQDSVGKPRGRPGGVQQPRRHRAADNSEAAACDALHELGTCCHCEPAGTETVPGSPGGHRGAGHPLGAGHARRKNLRRQPRLRMQPDDANEPVGACAPKQEPWTCLPLSEAHPIASRQHGACRQERTAPGGERQASHAATAVGSGASTASLASTTAPQASMAAAVGRSSGLASGDAGNARYALMPGILCVTTRRRQVVSRRLVDVEVSTSERSTKCVLCYQVAAGAIADDVAVCGTGQHRQALPRRRRLRACSIGKTNQLLGAVAYALCVTMTSRTSLLGMMPAKVASRPLAWPISAPHRRCRHGEHRD